jgi:hypothetical protein
MNATIQPSAPLQVSLPFINNEQDYARESFALQSCIARAYELVYQLNAPAKRVRSKAHVFAMVITLWSVLSCSLIAAWILGGIGS